MKAAMKKQPKFTVLMPFFGLSPLHTSLQESAFLGKAAESGENVPRLWVNPRMLWGLTSEFL